MTLWREDLRKVSERAAASLADPTEYPNLFPDLNWALKVEEVFKRNRGKVVPATEYPTAKDDLDLDLVALIKEKHASQARRDNEQVSHDPCASTERTALGARADGGPRDQNPQDSPSGDVVNTGQEIPVSMNVDDEANAILQSDFGNDDDDW